MAEKFNRLSTSPLALFFVKVGVVYAVWHLIYDYFILPHGGLDTFFSLTGVELGRMGLSLLGWDALSHERILWVFGTQGVEIQNGCNGIPLFGLYAGFIIAYPGRMDERMIFLVSGILFLFVVNVIRIMVFVLSVYYIPQHWEMFHSYASTIFFYPVVLSLWYLWTTRSSKAETISFNA